MQNFVRNGVIFTTISNLNGKASRDKDSASSSLQDLDDATVRENFFLDGVGLPNADSKAHSAFCFHVKGHLKACMQLLDVCSSY